MRNKKPGKWSRIDDRNRELAVLVLVLGGVGGVLEWFSGPSTATRPAWLVFAFLVATGLVIWTARKLYLRAQVRRGRRYTFARPDQRGDDICVQCGYSLVGSPLAGPAHRRPQSHVVPMPRMRPLEHAAGQPHEGRCRHGARHGPVRCLAQLQRARARTYHGKM